MLGKVEKSPKEGISIECKMYVSDKGRIVTQW